MNSQAIILMVIFAIILIGCISYGLYGYYKDDKKIDANEALTILTDVNDSIVELVKEYAKLKESKTDEDYKNEKEYIEEKMLEKLKLTNIEVDKAMLISQNLNIIIDYILNNRDKFIK